MSTNILFESRFLAESFVTGIWLMAVYDALRVLRLLLPHHFLIIGAEDLVYWVYAGITAFMLLYRLNDGGLRAFAVGSVFLGMVLYNSLVSRFFLKVLKKIIKYFRMKLSAVRKYRRRNK